MNCARVNDVCKIGRTQRISATDFREQFVANADGAFVPLTAGLTAPVVHKRQACGCAFNPNASTDLPCKSCPGASRRSPPSLCCMPVRTGEGRSRLPHGRCKCMGAAGERCSVFEV